MSTCKSIFQSPNRAITDPNFTARDLDKDMKYGGQAWSPSNFAEILVVVVKYFVEKWRGDHVECSRNPVFITRVAELMSMVNEVWQATQDADLLGSGKALQLYLDEAYRLRDEIAKRQKKHEARQKQLDISKKPSSFSSSSVRFCNFCLIE